MEYKLDEPDATVIAGLTIFLLGGPLMVLLMCDRLERRLAAEIPAECRTLTEEEEAPLV